MRLDKSNGEVLNHCLGVPSLQSLHLLIAVGGDGLGCCGGWFRASLVIIIIIMVVVVVTKVMVRIGWK